MKMARAKANLQIAEGSVEAREMGDVVMAALIVALTSCYHNLLRQWAEA